MRGPSVPLLAFLIHDKSRDVFFSALRSPFDHNVLFVQEASIGRWLPPVIDEEFPQHQFIVDAALSRDGKFLGIVYSDYDSTISTIIWEINAELHFMARARFGRWAKRVLTRTIRLDHSVYPGPGKFSRWIVFGEDERFHSPCRQIDLISGTVKPMETMSGLVRNCSFSENGHYVVVEKTENLLLKMSIQHPSTPEHLPWPKEGALKASLDVVSNTGRYVIFGLMHFIGYEFVLMDTLHMKSWTIPIESDLMGLDRRCLISMDETQLFDFRHVFRGSHVSLIIWRLPIDPTNTLVREFSLQDIAVSQNQYVLRDLYMLPDESSGWLVSCDGTMEKISWSHREGGSTEIQPLKETYFRMASLVSSDATRLGIVSYGQRLAQVQILDITSAGRLLRLLKLVLSEQEINHGASFYSGHAVFSPDLSLLFMSTGIFHVGHHDEKVATTPISLQPPIPCPPDRVSIEFSSCNRYTACIFVDHSENDNGRIWKCQLLHIDFNTRSIDRINIPIFKNSTYSRVAFHPSLPLVIVQYNETSLGEESILAQTKQVAIFDLAHLHSGTALTTYMKQDLDW